MSNRDTIKPKQKLVSKMTIRDIQNHYRKLLFLETETVNL